MTFFRVNPACFASELLAISNRANERHSKGSLFCRRLSGWFALAGFIVLSLTVHAATHTLDLIKFTPPAGWSLEERGEGLTRNVVLTRVIDQNYCVLLLCTGTPATGDLAASFASEWKSVALLSVEPVAAPTPTISQIGNARAAVGGAMSKSQGKPLLALLFVVEAGKNVVSILAMTPNAAAFDAFNADVQSLFDSVVVQPVFESVASSAPPVISGGKVVIPPPDRVLTVADLAGEWGRDDGIRTTYVDRTTGAYAGTESIRFKEKWVITADGKIALDFYGVRNGQKIAERSSGTVTLSRDGVLSITMSNRQMYVLRGWLVGPAMTVMKINGPWYDEIPANIFSNPAQGANLDKHWVRAANP